MAEIVATNLFSEPHSAIHIPQSAFRIPISFPLVYRLKLGIILTLQVSWGQPYEGIFFDRLYSRMAFQKAYDSV
jgi:hypothetical protein